MCEFAPNVVRVPAELGAVAHLFFKDLLEFVKLHWYSLINVDAI